MKLTISGDISQNIVQSLCQLYFPGEKFSQREENSPHSAEISVQREGSAACATVCLTSHGKVATATHVTPLRPYHTDKATARIAVGSAFLAAGRDLFGYAPPWGILTGIRSSKVALDLLGRVADTSKVQAILESDYLLQPEKAALVMTTALHERQTLQSVPDNACCLYISIPFCPTRCTYCSFVSYSTPRLMSLIPDYVTRLLADIERMSNIIRERGKEIVSIYIGGGTPTTLSAAQLEQVLVAVRKSASDVCEITLEAGRPDTITREKLSVAKDLGVNRVCINPQTLSDSVLSRIGRNHTAADFFRAYEMARSFDFDSINTDLIAGLPDDTPESFEHTMNQIIRLRPENITVHSFSLKKSAYEIDSTHDHFSATRDIAQAINYSQQCAHENGYAPYYMYRQKNTPGNFENVGFSLQGKECVYNPLIMSDRCDIYAVGAGGATKIITPNGVQRLFMPKYPHEYLSDDPKHRSIAERVFAQLENNI